MSVLLTSRVWDRITTLVRKQPTRCHVAVAYFGSGASGLLPLKKGSTLVVAMSERAVRSGQTKPSEVLKLMNRQVEVHTVQNLHAKVFATVSSAIIGSTNVSHSSADRLVEAAVETQDSRLVRSCRDFVRSLKGELVTPGYAKRMQQFYKPPRFGVSKGKGNGKRGRADAPKHSPTWAVPLVRYYPNERQTACSNIGRPKARKRLRSRHNFSVDEFFWSGLDLLGRLHVDDLILQVTDESPSKQMVSPLGRVLHIEKYKLGRTWSGVVFVEVSNGLRRKNQRSIVASLGSDAKFLADLKGPKVLRDTAFVHSLLNLWKRNST